MLRACLQQEQKAVVKQRKRQAADLDRVEAISNEVGAVWAS
jgi:hypothetical protein